MIWSGVLVQMKGSQRSFQPSMNRSIASISSRAERWVPRRIVCRVMIPKKISPGLPDEVWFSIAERQASHRGTFTSVRDLNRKIRGFIDNWSDRAYPFTWTKTADQILAKANRQKISDAGH